MATSLLIEAFLYEEQTRRGVSLQHWDTFGDIAEHCTLCHKCATPCPVDIDFGDVSMAMRDLLRRTGKQRFNAGTAAAMLFLDSTRPETIKLTRSLMIDVGYRAQRLGHRALKAVAAPQTRRPPATTGGGEGGPSGGTGGGTGGGNQGGTDQVGGGNEEPDALPDNGPARVPEPWPVASSPAPRSRTAPSAPWT